MSDLETRHPIIASIEHQGRGYTVRCRIGFDGIDHVGRLWFCEVGWDDPGLPDRAAIVAPTRDEVLERARRLSLEDLTRRHRRALAEKRKYLQLRRTTEEILTQIRYMNQIAISVRDGLLDSEGAHQEIELTERQLHDCVSRLRLDAGVEG